MTNPKGPAAAKCPLFLFGAGISAGSGLPLGNDLTWHWLEHHLPAAEVPRLGQRYRRAGRQAGREAPRLEKVIDDAIWTFGAACLANLEFFRDTPPNAVHRALADHLVRHRTYAFTTNFDDAIERYRPEIPVLTPATGITAPWGLVKLHGSVGEDPARLGASIANLQRGLTPAFADLWRKHLRDPACELVVLGYSGSDFFDVVPFFYESMWQDGTFPASVSWLLHHSFADADADWTDADWEGVLSEGALTMLKAFEPERKAGYAGPTPDLLRRWLPVDDGEPVGATRPSWRQDWEARYKPTDEQRVLYAAKLYASFGMGRESGRLVPLSGLAGNRFEAPHQLLCNALRDQGLYDAELRLRRWARTVSSSRYGPEFLERQTAATLRLSGRSVRAFLAYAAILRRYRGNPAALLGSRDPQAALWAVAEAGLFAESLVSVLPQAKLVQVCLTPLRLLFLVMVARALEIYHGIGGGEAGKEDPHLVATMHRLSGTLGRDHGAWASRALVVLCGGDLPVFLRTDTGEGRYAETDSFLGIVNQTRSQARARLADMVGWGWFGPRGTEDDLEWLKDAAALFGRSLVLARAIDDPMGEIKGLRGLRQVLLWLGKRGVAQRLAARLQTCRIELRRRRRAAEAEVLAWLAKGPVDSTGDGG